MKHPGLLNRNEVTFHNNNTKLQNSQNIEKGIIDFVWKISTYLLYFPNIIILLHVLLYFFKKKDALNKRFDRKYIQRKIV